ncbi:MAG: histidine phosphatase family protein [Paludibacter sp.]|nr:histidine phosphatase family protein [Paludibacter sp.]
MNLKESISSTTVICIIRHGETDWNSSGRLQGHEDIELNELGRKQAIETSRYFETETWDIVISSPLKRAFETAQIIAKRLLIPKVHIVEEIIERSYGEASGLLPEERRSRFPEGVIPGQEDFEHLRQRAMIGLNKIVSDFQGKKIIVVSHGGLTNSILYSLSNGEFGSFKTRLKNGCINKIKFQNNMWTVEFYNKTTEELVDKMENQKKLYSKADVEAMRIAENSRLMGKNRVEELINYAEKSGIKRIGIANCVGMPKETAKLKARLSEKFEVYSVDCKVGKLKSAELLDDDSKGTSCNPAGQADYLNENETELNISFGLCMGHDIMFNQKSKAPVTTLIVKDREHKHNPYKEFED